MTLLELLSVIDENASVEVINAGTDEILSEYNGHDSIDEIYNDWIVKKVTVFDDSVFYIYVEED